MSATLIPTKPDASPLLAWSSDGLLALMFPKTRSSAYEAVLAAARLADRYAEQPLGKSLFHLAGFGRSRQQASLALLATRHMRGIKGFQAFARGAELPDRHSVDRVLTCYQRACGCADVRAHCVVVLPAAPVADARPRPAYDASFADIFGPAPTHYPLATQAAAETFPCRLLRERGFHLQPGHPSSAANQIQAGAVRHGCDWCPNFKPERWK